jgi:DNA-binding NtrC family response regulator
VVFVVDDDRLLCPLIQQWLEHEGHEVGVYHSGEASLTGLTQLLPEAVCLDLGMPGLGGLETLRRIKNNHPQLPVLVMTADLSVTSVVAAMKLGAWDYLVKPLDRTKLVTELRNAVEHNRMAVRLAQLEREAKGDGYPGIIGTSKAMLALFRQLDRIAPSDITVLIQGESGTGKELVAKAIHKRSGRNTGPFVALSCAAIPESLQESELFGHEKGAFTGASQRRAGCFERADGGTLFLDEIAELTPSAQAKMLRVLQERRFLRLGGSRELASDFRLVAATHRDLASEVASERFREDLYYRVAVMEVALPPLRNRRDDIPLLVEHLLEAAANKVGRPGLIVVPDAMDALCGHAWPGNVRELQNAIERAVVVASADVITTSDLPARFQQRDSGPGVDEGASGPALDHRVSISGVGAATQTGSDSEIPSSPIRTLEELERDAIAAALARHQGKIAPVVTELGTSRTTLYRKMLKYKLQ